MTPWGEVKHAICVKHTIIISQDVDKNFITEDESHYINAILNSSIVHAYIHATFKTNGFSLKNPISASRNLMRLTNSTCNL